jgi:serine/threonine-protein kinase
MNSTVERIGRYEIVDEVGRGAMGVVYRAIDPNIGRTVALKTMRLDVNGIAPDDLLRRFKYEARAAGAMNHPNIVTVYDANDSEGLFYIAMEFMEGQTLQSLLTENCILPTEQVIELSRQVCAGLDYAHSLKVIHRDVKPANIMITPQNVLKIMDFGIAKAAGTMTSGSQVLGSPNYMSPEQLKGLELDGRSDLFSYGVILYEMLTGQKPFDGESIVTIIYKIANEDPIPPHELNPHIDRRLGAVIMRALSKDPQKRYQTGAALVSDIQNYTTHDFNQSGKTSLPATVGAAVSTRKDQSMSGIMLDAGGPKTIPIPMRRTPTRSPRAGNKNPLIALGALTVICVLAGLYSLYTMTHPHSVLSKPRPFPQTAQVAGGVTVTTGPEIQPAPEQRTKEIAAPGTPDKPVIAEQEKPVEATSQPAEKPSIFRIGGKAQVRFTSVPDGAAIEIDGKSSSEWVTPFSMAGLARGTHQVVLTKTGYSPHSETFEVGRRSTTYSATLQAINTAVSIATEPAGASIEIDGANTGAFSPAQIPVATGYHRIVVYLDGFRAAFATASINDGQVYRFAPVLNPSDSRQAGNVHPRLGKLWGSVPAGKGMVDFRTNPAGARISVNGHDVPIATPAHAPLAAGNYVVIFREPGYKPAEKTVRVEAGKLVMVDTALEPE